MLREKSSEIKSLGERVVKAETQVASLEDWSKRLDDAAKRLYSKSDAREENKNDVRKKWDDLEIKNKDIKDMLDIIIPDPCLIGLRGFTAGDCSLPTSPAVADKKNP